MASSSTVAPVYVFRDVDKRAAKLTDGEIIVLYTLAAFRNSKTGRCDPSLPTIEARVGRSRRQVQRIIDGLANRGIIRVTPGRHHTPTSYEFSLDGLPLVQRRNDDVTSDEGQRRSDSVTPPDGPRGDIGPGSEVSSAAVRGDIGSPQRRNDGVTLRREEDLKEREEGAPPAPAPSSLDGSEIGESETFALADEVAVRHGRPRPARGPKSVEAVRGLLREAQAAAKAGGWRNTTDALLARLTAHYAREDAGLAKCGYALKLAFQVQPAQTPGYHRPGEIWRAPKTPPLTPEQNAATDEEAAAAVAQIRANLQHVGNGGRQVDSEPVVDGETNNEPAPRQRTPEELAAWLAQQNEAMRELEASWVKADTATTSTAA